MKRAPWLPWLLLPLVGALAFYVLAPAQEITYHEVIVPAARIIEREPPTEVRFRDRIVYRYVQVEQRATAPGGAHEQVQSFCAPVLLTKTDTVEIEKLVLIRSVVHDPSWFFSRDRLLVTSVANTGDLEASDYRVRPGFSAIAAGDSLLVRYPRLALPRELLEITSLLAAGFGLAKVF